MHLIQKSTVSPPKLLVGVAQRTMYVYIELFSICYSLFQFTVFKSTLAFNLEKMSYVFLFNTLHVLVLNNNQPSLRILVTDQSYMNGARGSMIVIADTL